MAMEENKAITKMKVKAIFQIFDEDEDGSLNMDEYKNYLRGIHMWGVGPYTERWGTAADNAKWDLEVVTKKNLKELYLERENKS